MTSALSDMPKITDTAIKKFYIKDGKRRVQTDSGFMMMPAGMSRTMFGKMKGGKYSEKQ